MSKEDEEKTSFITLCGTYCFVRMPFVLKSVGSTFARAIQIGFEPELHRNIEAYMDDIVVKTKDRSTLIQDLEETFTNQRKINLKLNPEKCVFGVPSGKLLGFFVSHHGIEANPDKIKAIEQIQALWMFWLVRMVSFTLNRAPSKNPLRRHRMNCGLARNLSCRFLKFGVATLMKKVST